MIYLTYNELGRRPKRSYQQEQRALLLGNNRHRIFDPQIPELRHDKHPLRLVRLSRPRIKIVFKKSVFSR